MLIERHALRGGLPADPRVFLGHDDPAAHARRRQCGGDAAKAAADDQHVRGHLPAGGLGCGR